MGMSVHHQHIILYGYEIGYETLKELDDIDDAFENPLIREYDFRDRSVGDVVVVADGRRGEYCYLGVLQYQSKDSRDGRPIIEPQTADVPDTDAVMKLGEIIGEYDLGQEEEPQVHIFTHVM